MAQELERSIHLIHAAQDGNSDALNTLFGRYYDRVLRIVRARMGVRVRSVMDSGDVLQNTFMTAVKVFDRFEIRSESSLIHWLAQIAERQIRDVADHATAKKRDVDRQVKLASNPDLHPPAGTDGPLEQLDARDREEVLMRAIDTLSDEHRELVIERLFANATWEEVAERVGKSSPASARMAYGTAKAKLARKLLELGFQETEQVLRD